MGRTCYNSDEDTEDASESEMPKHEYEYLHNRNPHHHHNQHHHHHHLQQHQQQQQLQQHQQHRQQPYSTDPYLKYMHQIGPQHMKTHCRPSDPANNYTELREQMYLDKLMNLREQLYQLDAGIHPEFIKQLERVEAQRQDRMLLNESFQIYETERVEREYINEKKAALREFEDRKVELRESLISELEDRKRIIENDRSTMELLSDCTDTKPVTTRKLRRRPNEPIPVPDKRRRTSPAQLNHQLEDKEIQEDLKVLNKAMQAAQNAEKAANAASAGGGKKPKNADK